MYRGRTHKQPDLLKSVWRVSRTATEIGLLTSSSPDNSIDSKYGVVDVLEAGEKTLKSSTLKSFNKKAQHLAAGVLTTDDNDNTEDLPAYNGFFTDDGEDIGLVFPSDKGDTNGGKDNDSEDIAMSDSDTLLED